MTWEDVLRRDDIVGGDILMVEHGVSFQGQIVELGQEGNTALIRVSWCARRNRGEAVWRAVDQKPFLFPLDQLILGDQPERRIRIVTAFSGEGFFFPVGDHQTLDPYLVQGLSLPR